MPRDLSHQEGLVPDLMGLLGKLAVAALALGVVGAAAFWFLTMPTRLGAAEIAALGAGDAARGERIFRAGGCTSCHARPKSTGAAQLELAGGLELKTPFGTFVPPNISSDPNGRHRRMVARRFRQRHAARRFARRPALLSGIPLRLLCAHEAGRHCRPLRLSEDAAGGSGQGAGQPARLPLQHPSRARPVEAALSQRSAGDRPCSRRAGTGRGRALSCRRAGPLRRVPHAARVHRRVEERPVAGGRAGRRRVRHRPQHHLRRGRHRLMVGRRTSPTTWKPASSRTSIRSAAPWSTSRRTSPC